MRVLAWPSPVQVEHETAQRDGGEWSYCAVTAAACTLRVGIVLCWVTARLGLEVRVSVVATLTVQAGK